MRSATAAASTPIRSEAWSSSIAGAPRVDRDQGERGAGRRDRERREHRPAVPRRVLATFGHLARDRRSRAPRGTARRTRSAGRPRVGRPRTTASSHSRANAKTPAADRADGDEHPEVRDVGSREREGAVGRDTRGDDQRELGGGGRARRVRCSIRAEGTGTASCRSPRSAGPRRPRSRGGPRAPRARGTRSPRRPGTARPPRGSRRRTGPSLGGSGPVASVIRSAPLTTPMAAIPRPSERRAPPRVLMPAPQQDHDRRQQAGARDDREPDPSATPERLETAYAKATPPPATSRTKGANHGALRCVCVDIVRASMMNQAGSRLHHPTGVIRWTRP